MAAISQRAVSKAILAGEHFVVHGSPALAIPIFDLYLDCSLLPNQPHSHENSLIQQGWEICRKHLGHLPGKWGIQIESKIPLASGMGSSAALSVALARAYGQALGKKLTPQEVFEISMELEKIAHGKPSGIDSTVITYEKPLYFRKNKPPRFFEGSKKVGIIILDTHSPSSTRETVSRVQEFRNHNSSRFDQIAQKANEVVEEFFQALIEGDLPNLASLALENHNLLKEIGVYSSITDQAQEAALKAGAKGAKMSGGGGGGIVLAFSEPDQMDAIKNRLKETPFTPLVSLVF